mgnify:CR=1 FL=1
MKINEYIHILKFDNDSYNRWDAIQNLYLDCYLNNSTVKLLSKSLRDLLLDKKINFTLMALFLELPSRETYENLLDIADPINVYLQRIDLIKSIAINSTALVGTTIILPFNLFCSISISVLFDESIIILN